MATDSARDAVDIETDSLDTETVASALDSAFRYLSLGVGGLVGYGIWVTIWGGAAYSQWIGGDTLLAGAAALLTLLPLFGLAAYGYIAR